MNRQSLNLMGLAEIPTLASSKHSSNLMLSTLLFNKEFNSSMEQNEAGEILRYLCVSNGYEIFCLNLKEGEGQSFSSANDIPLLPKVGTLDLLEKGLPTSVGLLNLGSYAYMIGGQKFPAFFGERDPDCIHSWGEDPQGINLYRTFCETCKVKGSSRDIYALSLVGHTLSHSKSDIVQPKKPKLWPIVEKIDGQTHVIDSVPPQLESNCIGWITSHEVLSCDHDSWSDVSTVEDMGYIYSHTVVGHRIFAAATEKCLVFDSKTGNWEAPHPSATWLDPFRAREVWQILDLGIGRCVGGFTYGEPNNPLYVLIAIVHDCSDENCPLHAVAYLVTSMGKVVCFQPLPHFFEGPVKPYNMESGTMIDVDEKGNKMCFIMSATGTGSSDYVFIGTFTVERVTEADSKVQELWAKGTEAWSVEQEFVRVDLKDSYIYKSDDGLGSLGMLGLRASFLPVCSREE